MAEVGLHNIGRLTDRDPVIACRIGCAIRIDRWSGQYHGQQLLLIVQARCQLRDELGKRGAIFGGQAAIIKRQTRKVTASGEFAQIVKVRFGGIFADEHVLYRGSFQRLHHGKQLGFAGLRQVTCGRNDRSVVGQRPTKEVGFCQCLGCAGRQFLAGLYLDAHSRRHRG